MRSSGQRLFVDAKVKDALLAAEQRAMRDAVLDLLLVNPAATRLQLRRAAFSAALPAPIRLGRLQPAVMTQSSPGEGMPFTLRCIIPFVGDRQLFRCSVPMWPPARDVKGLVQEGALVLAAEGWPGDEKWLAAVIGSEIAEVERILAAQSVTVRAHARALDARAKALIERVYPRINHFELVRVLQAASLGCHPRTEELARRVVNDLRARTWRNWSR